MLKLLKQYKSIELDIKRLHLGEWEVICPKCGEKYGTDEYVSFITTDDIEPYYCECEKCGNEWIEKFRVTLSVEVLGSYDNES